MSISARMGLTESKVITERLQKAYLEAEECGRDDIQHVLKEDEFMGTLNRVWKQLPSDSRNKIKEIRKAKKRKIIEAIKPCSQPPATPADTHMQTAVKHIERWKADVSSFFVEEDTITPSTIHPEASIYLLILQLEEREGVDLYRRRFLKVIFHRFLERISGRYRLSCTIERATAIIRRSTIIADDTEVIENHVRKWDETGRRLDLLCRDLGGAMVPDENRPKRKWHLGNLFCLPDYVTDRYLRKKLPLEGSNREDELERLKKELHGFAQYATLNDFAVEVYDYLWSFIELSLVKEGFVTHQAEPNTQDPKNVFRATDPSRDNGLRGNAILQSSDFENILHSDGSQIPINTSSSREQVTEPSFTRSEQPISESPAESSVTWTTFTRQSCSTSQSLATIQQVQTEMDISPDDSCLVDANNEQEQTPTETIPDDFGLQSYLFYTSAPADFSGPGLQHPDVDPGIFVQQPCAINANNQQEQTPTETIPDDFGLQSYLFYTSAPADFSGPGLQHPDVDPGIFVQQPCFTSLHSSIEPEQTRTVMSTDGFQLRPHLQYASSQGNYGTYNVTGEQPNMEPSSHSSSYAQQMLLERGQGIGVAQTDDLRVGTNMATHDDIGIRHHCISNPTYEWHDRLYQLMDHQPPNPPLTVGA